MNTRRLFICFLAILLSLPMLAQDQSGFVPKYSCAPDPPSGYQKLVIDAQTMTRVDGVLQHKNDDKVWIIVKNINPLVAQYVIKVKRTPVQESAIASFASLIGGPAASLTGNQTSSPQSKAPPSAEASMFAFLTSGSKKGGKQPVPPPSCDLDINALVIQKYNKLRADEASLNNDLSSIDDIYSNYASGYQQHLSDAQKANACPVIEQQVTSLRTFLEGVQSPDSIEVGILKGRNVQEIASDQDPTRVLRLRIAELTSEAKDVRKAILDFRTKASGNQLCQARLQDNSALLEDDESEIDRMIGPTDGTPELQVFSDHVTQLKSRFDQLTSSRDSVRQLFDRTINQNPFTLTQPLTDNQADDEVTVEPANSTSPSPKAKTAKSGSNAPAAGADSPAKYDETLHFGLGARFTISAGIVISLLEKREFTTANGQVNGQPNNQVAFSDNSRTRVLPMGLLNARFYDCLPEKKGCLWFPTHFSFGTTAKPDNKGTMPEFLFGPSWAFVQRQLFFTVGAYAGTQQRLLGGLSVNSTTTLAAANLPVAKEYHWNVGFAIAWKVK